MHLPEEIERAARRIGPHVLYTPLFESVYLGEMNRGTVGLKLESEQYTGSFKARGALNKVLSMSAEQKAAGLLTASSGNHAQGFARALTVSGDRGLIYLPENAEPSKVEALQHYDVELAFHGNGCLETELHARAQAEQRGMAWVSPYNDPVVIAGQGTVGKEILEQMPEVDVILATVGGGGLISGIAAWVRRHRPKTEIIGCLPENSPEMYLSVQQGQIVNLDEPMETLSDGSAGGCEPGSITFDLCREGVDDYILTSETEIADAIRWMANHHHKIIEGAAGVALAAFQKNPARFNSKNVAIVICGANITTPTLKVLL
ncbi:MAG: threonine/serine dehydratase [Xanthomonadales bacterium]|nr:threonine/serine dehydratase [Xanthomonadales bacterium]